MLVKFKIFLNKYHDKIISVSKIINEYLIVKISPRPYRDDLVKWYRVTTRTYIDKI